MRKMARILALLLAAALVWTGLALGAGNQRTKVEDLNLPVTSPTPEPEGPIIDPRSIADYLFAHEMQLPDNFLTKKEARELGWDSQVNYLSDVAPGMSIGGDRFGNYEGILPREKGLEYHECDCYYTGGRRNACRIVYSSDGRVWYTEDHYQTFVELFPTLVTESPEGP